MPSNHIYKRKQASLGITLLGTLFLTIAAVALAVAAFGVINLAH